MAFTKPPDVPNWADDDVNNVDPGTTKSNLGWVFQEVPPSSFENFRAQLVGQWFKYINERVFDGATNQDFRVQGVDRVTADGADLDGGTIEVSGAQSTGDGGSIIDFKVAKAAQGSGTTERAPVRVGGFGTDGRFDSTEGITAQADTTSPVVSAFRIVPQDADPTGPNAVGDIYSTTEGILRICAVAGTPGEWVTVGTSIAVANWFEQPNPDSASLFSVATDGSGNWVAVGDDVVAADSYIITSNNGGLAWTERPNPKNFELRGVATDNSGNWVAVGAADGTDAYIITSTDNGATWTERPNPKNIRLLEVATDGSGNWVAVGLLDGTDAYLITSTDNGVTWTERSNPKNFSLTGVATDNLGNWVAVGGADGTDAYLITSTDNGVTWTERPNPKNSSLTDVATDNLGNWVAVGGADGTDAYLITSTNNGATWTERANPVPDVITFLNNVAVDGVTWVAVGGTSSGTSAYLITSVDNGLTWTQRNNPKENSLQGVAFDSGGFVAVGTTDGTDAYILTSLKTA